MKKDKIFDELKDCGYDIKRESSKAKFDAALKKAKEKTDSIRNDAYFDSFFSMPNYNKLLIDCKEMLQEGNAYVMTIYIHGLKDFFSFDDNKMAEIQETVSFVKNELKKAKAINKKVYYGYGYLHILEPDEATVKTIFKAMSQKYSGTLEVGKKYSEIVAAKGKESKRLLAAIKKNVAWAREKISEAQENPKAQNAPAKVNGAHAVEPKMSKIDGDEKKEKANDNTKK